MGKRVMVRESSLYALLSSWQHTLIKTHKIRFEFKTLNSSNFRQDHHDKRKYNFVLDPSSYLPPQAVFHGMKESLHTGYGVTCLSSDQTTSSSYGKKMRGACDLATGIQAEKGDLTDPEVHASTLGQKVPGIQNVL
jgi:hypothetical protein